MIQLNHHINIIGIQKALGAKNVFILNQFLFESIFLCLLGGFLGLVIVSILSSYAGRALDFNVSLTISNIILGISISLIIGIISGIIPALTASKMDPVDAIRSN